MDEKPYKVEIQVVVSEPNESGQGGNISYRNYPFFVPADAWDMNKLADVIGREIYKIPVVLKTIAEMAKDRES